MKRNTTFALIATMTLSANISNARETVISTEISSGIDYSDRTYDDAGGQDGGAFPTRDDERSNFVISPTINIFTESTSDSALLSYKPYFNYDLIESESGDINQEASAGFHKILTENWDLKLYNFFKNTDEYETNRPVEDSISDDYVEELLSSISSMNDTLQDESGTRRYSRNEFNIATGYNYQKGSRFSLGYGWDHLEYDEDDTASGTYEDYNKYNVSIAVSHELSELWTVKGYSQYLRGIYETDDDSDNDLDEYHLGAELESRIIPSHPLLLSYDFSETNYDDDTIGISRIHKLTLGYQPISLPALDVRLGAGPTYTDFNGSDNSWDANGNLNIVYRIGQGSIQFTSDLGTQFDNFSGTTERALTDYWRSRAEYNYPLSSSWQTSIYGGYSDEIRNEVESGSEIDVKKLSGGGVLKYCISDNYDVGLNYDYTVQDSDYVEDSYDEHSVILKFTFKTNLLSW
ncbi:MAG: hypothetical protein ACI8ZB_003890 [Desulforhopalus sp.]|jgi:hypothetical protein